MFMVWFALAYKDHMERPVSGVDCPDALSARAYKAKQLGNMLS